MYLFLIPFVLFLQAEASKGVSEALARISMVGEGIRAYRTGAVPAAAGRMVTVNVL